MHGAATPTGASNPFQAILNVGTALAASLDTEETFLNVARRIGEAMMSWGVEFETLSDDGRRLEQRAFWCLDGSGRECGPEPKTRDLADLPGVAQVLSGGDVVERSARDAASPADERDWLDAGDYKSCLRAPLRAGSEALGVVTLVEKRFVRHFMPLECDLFRQLCDLATIAVQNGRLLQRLDEQKRATDLLLDTARATTSSMLLEDVLNEVTARAGKMLQTSQAAVFRYDATHNLITNVAMYEADHRPGDDEWVGVPWSADESPSDLAMIMQRDVTIQQRDDPDLPPERLEDMIYFREFSVLSVPLWVGDTPLGLLRFYELDRRREFTAAEVELAGGLGELAAIAINNAFVYAALDEGKRHVDTLLRINEALASTADRQAVFATIARLGAEALGAPRAIIYEYAPDRDALVGRCYYESSATPGYDETGAVHALDGMSGNRAILELREPRVEHISDGTLDPHTQAEMKHWGEMTCMNVPLVGDDLPLGILMIIWTEEEHRVSPVELELASGIGRQAAIALSGTAAVRAIPAD